MSDLSHERVLVTGGAGFIGSALCRRMAVGGYQLCNIDKLTYAGNLENVREISGFANYKFLQGDICDRTLLSRVFDAFKPDAVIHLAAESHVDRSILGPADFVRTNILGTITLLEEAFTYWQAQGRRETFRFIHISTDEVYGSLPLDGGRFNELSQYRPSSPYSASKASSDLMALSWHTTYGLPVIVTNCSNNYGPYQFPEKLIPVIIIGALQGKALPVYGDGRNVRDWLHVDDHVAALCLVLAQGRPGQSYAIGSGTEISNLDLVHRICAHLDSSNPSTTGRSYADQIKFVADRLGHDRRYAINADKIGQEVGWKAQIDFGEGLRRTVEWYLANRLWWSETS